MSLCKWLCFCCGFTICLPVCASEKQAPVFPGDTWQRATPEAQGVGSAKLHEALDYLHDHASGVGTDEMVIIRNGYPLVAVLHLLFD